VAPAAALAVEGATASPVMVTEAGLTVTVVVPLIPLNDAVITDDPAVTPVTRPLVVTVATAVLDELHVTDEVTSAVLPSL
jgi:hypothetical protein